MNTYKIYKSEVLKLAEDGYVERELSEELLESSVYWYGHPSGYPVLAPKHAKRLSSPEITRKGTKSSDWFIQFGANAFSVSRAVSRCQKVLLDFLGGDFSRYIFNSPAVESSLYEKIRQSVENVNRYEYELYPINPENHMIFGVSSISVDEFIDALLTKCLLQGFH